LRQQRAGRKVRARSLARSAETLSGRDKTLARSMRKKTRLGDGKRKIAAF
jgi:hypothetical protein